MRRFVFTLAASVALAAVAPASALASHHRHGHHGHHGRARHAVTRHLRFGDSSTSPSTPASPGNAGTVMGLAGGVLTIQLSDGSTVSGKVGDSTALRCETAQPASTSHDDGDGGTGSGDQNGSGGDQSGGGGDQSGGGGDQSGGSDQSSSGEDQGDDDSSTTGSCGATSLVHGAVVRSAELAISSSGAVWREITLIS
jgi:hypothetical protein